MERKRLRGRTWLAGLAAVLLAAPAPAQEPEGAERGEPGAGIDHGYWQWDYEWPFDREHVGDDDAWGPEWMPGSEADRDRFGRFDSDYDWNTDDAWFGDWYGDSDRWFGAGAGDPDPEAEREREGDS
ncbi:MAG: hypothetical protein DCC71_23360 [Proteobacteria bacterium]|nr:MAG: hypothetical protein DCC71_23360 [Pseudomonadota bacterium]